MTHSTWQWILVDAFVKNFNKYWASYYVPSDLIFVDESMSKWYGLGGHWINMELHIYMVIDHTPVNRCDIKKSCDAISQVTMQLKLLKLEDEEDRYMAYIRADVAHQIGSVHLLHRTKVLIDLVKPWKNKRRKVCADSYFSYDPDFDELEKIELQFFGVVMTAKTISYERLKLQLPT